MLLNLNLLCFGIQTNDLSGNLFYRKWYWLPLFCLTKHVCDKLLIEETPFVSEIWKISLPILISLLIELFKAISNCNNDELILEFFPWFHIFSIDLFFIIVNVNYALANTSERAKKLIFVFIIHRDAESNFYSILIIFFYRMQKAFSPDPFLISFNFIILSNSSQA